MLAILLGVTTATSAQTLLHYQMGEGSLGGEPAPAELEAKAGELLLAQQGSPTVIADVAPRARARAMSERGMRFGKGDAYRGSGLPTSAKQGVAIEAWVRPAGTDTSGTIVHVGKGGGFGIAQNKTGLWGVVEGRGTVGWSNVQPGEWTHLALVLDGGGAALYVDGEPAGQADLVPWGYKQSEPLSIGANYKPSDGGFVGDIDEVRLLQFPEGGFSKSMLLYHGGEAVGGGESVATENVDGGGAVEQLPTGEAGMQVIGGVFDQQPRLRGIEFERSQAEPVRVKVGDEGYWAWQVPHGNIPDKMWMRAFRFQVTDPAFKQGGRPAVDVEIKYLLDAFAGIDLYASTTEGWKRVGGSWGGKTNRWGTLRARLDNAWFGQAKGGHGGQGPGGFDLMIAGANAPMVVRSIEVTGYDPEEDVRWDRMLRLDQPRPINHEDDTTFVFRRRSGNGLELDAVNLSRVERPLSWRLEVTDWEGGQTVHQASGQVRVGPQRTQPLRFDIDTTGWALGPYQGRIELRLNERATEPVLSRRFRMGVIDDDVWTLPKAANNEYMFGLDAGNSTIVQTGDAIAGAWYDLMGVDILRDMPYKGGLPSKESWQKANDFMQRHRIRAGLRVEPPKPTEQDAAWREQENRRRADLLAWGVQRFGGKDPGKAPFVELGNEPDLPVIYFWPGTMQEYADAMKVLAQAAQQAKASAGLTDEDVLVANGGLSFAGPKGDERSREFLRIVDASDLDAIAYHAHGPGRWAEKMAYERLRGAMEGTGTEGLPVFDTETGFAGSNEAGLIEQARTAIEKNVYAKSVGMPYIMFFRLFMEGGSQNGYGLTDHRVEPRPSVLAYRQMVRRLRGHRFAREIDATEVADAPGAVMYLFAREQAGGPDDFAIVAFSTEPSQYEMSLHVPGLSAAGGEVELLDMFGNPLEARTSPGDVVGFRVGVDPVYLVWSSDRPADAVSLTPPALALHLDEPLPTGHASAVPVVVRNPGESPMTARVKVEADARVPVMLGDYEQTVTLSAGERRRIDVPLRIGESNAPLDLPRWWRVFPDADPERMSESDWARMPDRLRTVGGGNVQGQQVWAEDGEINFGKVAGSFSEKRPVVGYAYLDSPTAVELPAAATADWWMAIYCNGQRVYSTLDTGNRHGTLADHTFTLPLRAGRNVLAFQCLSGSAGWSIGFGGPAERALAESGGVPRDRVRVELVDTVNGEVMAEQLAALPLTGPLPSLDGSKTGFDMIAATEPVAVLGADAVTNLYVEQPDASRWYQGEEDLSAIVWAHAVDDGVLFTLAVRDDRHRPAVRGEDPADHDAARLVLANTSGGPFVDVLLSDGSSAASAAGLRNVSVRPGVTMPGGESVTLYQATVTHHEVAEPFRLTLRVFDRDAAEMKQTLDLGDTRNAVKGTLLHVDD